MLKLLRQRNFSLLWFGQFISIIGDWVLFIALPFYTYSLTGSVLATGAMFMIGTLPRVFLGSLAGTFVDRWDRKRTMIVADILRIATTLMLLLVHSREWLWVIYVSAFLEAVFTQFFYPAKSAIIPLLVGEKELITANSLNGLSDALTRLVGSGLGGMLMGWLGFSSVVLLDAGSFAISALLLVFIAVPALPTTQPKNDQATAPKRAPGIWRELADGMQLVGRERVLQFLFIISGVALLGDSMVTVMIVPMVKTLLGGGAQLLGWMMMAQGVGGLIGGLLLGQLGNRIAPRRLAAVGLTAIGAVILIIASLLHPTVVLMLMIIAGIAGAAWMISCQTLLQLGTTDQFRGRIFGTFATVSALASLLGMGLAGILSETIGLLPALFVSGSLYSLSGVMAWIMLPKAQPSQSTQTITKGKDITTQRVPAK